MTSRFPMILIATDHRAPQILKHRRACNRKGEYFGPFASAGPSTAPLICWSGRSCCAPARTPYSRAAAVPACCIRFRRCSAPCTGLIGLEDYNALVEEARRFLRGESQNARQMYQRLMEEASANLDFERAAGLPQSAVGAGSRYRRPVHQPGGHRGSRRLRRASGSRADRYSGVLLRLRKTWVIAPTFRAPIGRSASPRCWRALSPSSTMTSRCPRAILLSHKLPNEALLAEALSTKAERKVEVNTPQRGAKVGIVEHASQNAREALARRLAESASQRQLLAGLGNRLGLGSAPRRIEVFDNSHIMGTHAVGAMIVAGSEGFVNRSIEIQHQVCRSRPW